MTGATMTPAFASKLTKVLGMLGSDHDGEIAAAGRKAHSMLQAEGLTWGEVIAPARLAPPPRSELQPRRWHKPESVRDVVALCLRWPEVLTEWAVTFLGSIADRVRLSDKQSKTLMRILNKVEAAAVGDPLNFAEINRRAMSRIEDLCRRWLPDGKREGREWRAMDPQCPDHRPRGLSVNLTTGRWCTYGGAAGGDLISLAAYLAGCRQSEAARNLASMMGMEVPR
jgi:hypothetical protein